MCCCCPAVRKPSATTQELLELMPGPDFPTGGLIVEDSDAILQAYETGRGSFRMRARWEVEQGRFGTWHIVVTQIPYQVQKSRLIEQIADLLDQKKLPLLGDIRDESTDEIRLILEPKTRGIEPEVLMETLFRATPLESRFGLNMNVLGADRSPGVMGLKQVIQAWLDHRHEVLERRSRHRLTAVERRLEILSGFLAVYLNLDEVIRIIREEDDAKASLIATYKLTDLQAESVLNMRLRSLRRLEEMEIRKEHDALSAEKAALMALLDSEKQRWKTIERELTGMIKAFGKGRLGERRSTILSAPKPVDISVVEEVEREPLTMILSQKGWVRAVKGHNVDLENQKFKEGDALKLAIPCQTTDRLCFFATDGRAYTVKGADLPRGRGDGQPIRLLIDLSNDEDLLAVFPIEDGKRRLVASSAGRGMLVDDETLVAEKRSGRQVLNLKEGEFARVCVPAEGDHVAVVGDNRRFLIFPLEQLPVMTRGLGVALQKYSDGGLRQAVVFTAADGLLWPGTARVRQFADLQDWVSRRAAVGKVAPPWAAKKA